ncbi:YceI family protein [Ponticoccus sp. SC2-23]|uniref:YceI family protein n=1 Tax=Alexandriicola marinus TaxID=2081710 RepID=UPI000FDCA0EF|nr:YceI family protein [Alexandriicola marinus]MBM1221575.1 YceI family protein [Ponticoccus sp. SC6-9]MBM1226616.1 YceI family protein [Ponticoccus sp. SC6-15]MBM1230567.1 YceI family protein [Ponticoccus sp. SC6-38]MBM1235090.1 YceI family protein [Ponticoccus sp. SC6-45]MBM1239588.1 YceI family protein [Ponticoccus sp. SC6-49]MBM1243370.1 YceI family protein [Ponticoccus sp. SC2-64]MBM1248614.1 YceI family protein [Ponticoccus sp. SC6-42]MBM1253199.1 YceI family protein [Ponticoccus sp. 
MRVILFLAAMALAPALSAAPRDYTLDERASEVGFSWQFGEDTFTGTMEIAQADLTIDFEDVSQSRVTVAVDASRAEAGFPFATEAMRGPRVLDTAAHPLISFRSRSFTRTGPGTATIEGDLTVRGVTRPETITAQIYRAPGSDAGDLSRLTVLISGSLSRSAFGADGWSDLVGDTVTLDITATIAEGG